MSIERFDKIMTNNNTYNCKKIASKIYFHKSNLPAILAQSSEFKSALKRADAHMRKSNKNYEIIKYDIHDGRFSLINAVGWDKLFEPVVGTSCQFDEEGIACGETDNGKQVYHQKHLFVADDYTGFDISKSIKRTEIIDNLPEVRGTKGIKSRIGSLKFWNEFRTRNHLPAYMTEDVQDESCLHDFQKICGIQVEEIPSMTNFFKTRAPRHFEEMFKNFQEEWDFLMTSKLKCFNNKDWEVCDRITSNLLKTYEQAWFEAFVSLYKPWGSKPWSRAEVFKTLDNLFATKLYNGRWYMLPVTQDNRYVLTVTLPENIETYPTEPMGYSTRLECMMAHFVERMHIFYN